MNSITELGPKTFAQDVDLNGLLESCSDTWEGVSEANQRNRRTWYRVSDGRKGWLNGNVGPEPSSWDDLMDVMRGGWAEGADRLADLADTVEVPYVPDRRRRTVWRDEGDEIDPHRALRGQHTTAWASRRRTSASSPVVTISLQWGGNSNETGDTLFWRAVPAVVLAAELIRQGYSVELWGLMGTAWHDANAITRVRLLSAHESLSVEEIAALVAWPAAFRGPGISILESIPYNVGGGHGRSVNFTGSTTDEWARKIQPLVDDMGWTADITLRTTNDRAAAEAELRRVLEGL